MEVSFYRGSPVLNFQDNERFPTKMGVGKLKAVVDNLELALEFLEQYGDESVTDTLRSFRERFSHNLSKKETASEQTAEA